MSAAVQGRTSTFTKDASDIDAPNKLPKDHKVVSEAYHNEKSPLFIPTSVRSGAALLQSPSGSNGQVDYYVIFSSDDHHATTYARKAIAYFTEHRAKLAMAGLFASKQAPRNTKLLDYINNELIKKVSQIKSSSKTSQDILFTEDILIEAMKLKASDIHVESQGNGMAIVRARVNKELTILRHLTQKEAETFASVCYSTFPANTEDPGVARGVYMPSSLIEGIFQRRLKDYYIKGRMVNIAHNNGSNADFIIRLIDKNKTNKAKRFSEMGFSPKITHLMRRLESINSGAILTCGVTGSGKSTSNQNMYQLERDRSGGTRKIFSLEDPVEYEVDLITQITTSQKKEDTPEDKDFSFNNLNTKMMRGDPDTMAYGEIRDNETAEAAIKGALSGHLIYGTIHTSGALDVFERLTGFGIPLESICREGFLRFILFQHLLPKLCPHCAVSYTPGDEIPEKYDESFVAKFYLGQKSKLTGLDLAVLKNEASSRGSTLFRELQRKGIINSNELKELREKKAMLNESGDSEGFKRRLEKVVKLSGLRKDECNIKFRGHGCEHCLNGQIGITPAAEIIIPDNTFLELVRTKQKAQAKLYWRTMLGGFTAAEDCYDRLLAGIIDPRSVEEHLGDLGQ